MEKEILLEAIKQLGESVIRKNEADYRYFIEGENLNEHNLVEMMIAHPKTIERPLVIKDNKMALGRPIENVIALLQL